MSPAGLPAVLSQLVDAPTREQINRLEGAMREMPQVDVPVKDTFGPGFYARTIHIKAGTTLVGKVHATEHIFIVSKGSIELATEDGAAKVVHAPYQAVCRPGMKRVGHALTDVECTNVHITDETDPLRLESTLIQSEGIEAPVYMEMLG